MNNKVSNNKATIFERFDKLPDLQQVAIVTMVSCLIITILFICHVLITDSQLPMYKAKIDWLFALGTVIGIVGAAWAIKARIDAGKAFRASEKTLNALGISFDFYEILNENKFLSVIEKIGQSDTTISLYLGFPCVGYLYKDRDQFKKDPEAVFKKLILKLDGLCEALDSKEINDFVLKIGCFDKSESEKILKDKPILKSKENLMDSFYRNLDKLKQFAGKDDRNNQVIVQENFQIKEKLRFTSIYSSNAIAAEDNKAFIWIVPELNPDREQLITFDSAAFQTSEPKFIKVLESVFVNGNLAAPSAK